MIMMAMELAVASVFELVRVVLIVVVGFAWYRTKMIGLFRGACYLSRWRRRTRQKFPAMSLHRYRIGRYIGIGSKILWQGWRYHFKTTDQPLEIDTCSIDIDWNYYSLSVMFISPYDDTYLLPVRSLLLLSLIIIMVQIITQIHGTCCDSAPSLLQAVLLSYTKRILCYYMIEQFQKLKVRQDGS